jgi:sulfur relay (sulfurtransferase) complex TusBCD TusD component (DsrE family)
MMRLGMVVSVAEPETVFNVLRLANLAVGQGDSASVFLLGRGVELDQIEDAHFDVLAQARTLIDAGGEILACGTCLKLRSSQGSELCSMSTMEDLYELILNSDQVVTF